MLTSRSSIFLYQQYSGDADVKRILSLHIRPLVLISTLTSKRVWATDPGYFSQHLLGNQSSGACWQHCFRRNGTVASGWLAPATPGYDRAHLLCVRSSSLFSEGAGSSRKALWKSYEKLLVASRSTGARLALPFWCPGRGQRSLNTDWAGNSIVTLG